MALVAGGLATLNPCGFPVLSAFLSYYLGTEETRSPYRIARGLAAGMLVTAGFAGVFTVVGLPLAYGVAGIIGMVPWAGLVLGIVLTATGVAVLAGRWIALPGWSAPGLRWRRRPSTTLLFGVGHGVASFGCTLPVFLTLLGAAAGAGGTAAALAVFGAYVVGMAVVLVSLSLGVAFLHDGLARRVRRVLPYLRPLTAGLLIAAGIYLTYYWIRVGFGSPAAVVSDPLIGVVTRFTIWIEAVAGRGGVVVFAVLGVVVLAAAVVGIRQRIRPSAGRERIRTTRGSPDEHE